MLPFKDVLLLLLCDVQLLKEPAVLPGSSCIQPDVLPLWHTPANVPHAAVPEARLSPERGTAETTDGSSCCS